MAGGPNELAGMILALLPFLIAILEESRNVLIRLALLFCGGISLIALMLTGSRMPMIALVILGIYYVWRSRNKAFTVAFCGIILFTMWAKMPQAYRERYLTVKSYAEGGNLDGSNQLRLHIWKVGLAMFRDHPILGVGAGQFNTAYGTIYATRQHQAWMDPHNMLLEVGCEMGIIGLMAFGYFVIQIFKQVSLTPRVEDHSPLGLTYRISVACGAMLLGLVIMSSVSHLLFRPYWYVLGGLVAANWRVAHAALRKSSTVEARKEGDLDEGQDELVAQPLEGRAHRWDFSAPAT
jgi:O-antigen ligase